MPSLYSRQGVPRCYVRPCDRGHKACLASHAFLWVLWEKQGVMETYHPTRHTSLSSPFKADVRIPQRGRGERREVRGRVAIGLHRAWLTITLDSFWRCSYLDMSGITQKSWCVDDQKAFFVPGVLGGASAWGLHLNHPHAIAVENLASDTNRCKQFHLIECRSLTAHFLHHHRFDSTVRCITKPITLNSRIKNLYYANTVLVHVKQGWNLYHVGNSNFHHTTIWLFNHNLWAHLHSTLVIRFRLLLLIVNIRARRI